MKQRYVLRLWLSLIGLFFLTGGVYAHSSLSSLVFTEAGTGRRVEFTPFGTLVFHPQNQVSGAWRINYEDRSGRHSAWYFNRQFNSGVVPVSLTANLPNGEVLSLGVRLYVRAVMRTADGKLRITRRFSWEAECKPINSVLTFENTANTPVMVEDVIVWRPAEPPPVCAELCPYIPPVDGATIATSFVTLLGQRYIRTIASFTTPLQPTQAKDVPTGGCDGGKDPS